MTDDIIGRYESVSKSYGGLTVVKDLDLDIRRGEFLSLLGPSGSGKTTTLMMLAGLQSPSNGHIFLNGRPIDGIPPHRRNIGGWDPDSVGPMLEHYFNLPLDEINRRYMDYLKVVAYEEYTEQFAS